MSKGFSRAIVLRALILLAIAMALPTVLLAAGSNMSADPNASVAKGNTAGRSVAQPARSAPVRSSARTPAAFTPQMPLSEAIDILRNCTTPPLNLVVLWRSLDGAGVYKETPIGLDGLPGLKVRQYLDMLVLSLSAGASDKIAYVVQGGVITIGTTTALPKPRLETRVYDVRDLTAPPANYALPPMGYAGMYGNGPTGSYGGGFGAGYGAGLPYQSGGSSIANNSGGLPGLVANSYGNSRTRSNAPRRR